MAFGITDQGFRLKRLADIITSLQTRLSAVVDPDTGESLIFDPEANDPFNQMVNAFAAELAPVWEVAQMSYNQFDPAQASGPALRGLVQLNGVTVQAQTRSTVTLSLVGAVGLVIPAGRQIANNDETVVFTTSATVILDSSGLGSVDAFSNTPGPVTANANTITNILTPVEGWTSATNALAAIPGQDFETDQALRIRRDQSTEIPSIGPVEATHGNLLQISGVTFARVYINNTLSTDTRGIPAKSMAAVVVGGADADIARTLFVRNTTGLLYHGDASATVTDRQGFPYEIRWLRPTLIDVYVTVTIEVTNASLFPTNGNDLIRDAIVTYARQGATGLSITTGFNPEGFVPGANVVLSRLYTPINSIPGHRVTNLLIGTTQGGQTANDITIDIDEIASFDVSRITVTGA